jgi:hypothetical protein
VCLGGDPAHACNGVTRAMLHAVHDAQSTPPKVESNPLNPTISNRAPNRAPTAPPTGDKGTAPPRPPLL